MQLLILGMHRSGTSAAARLINMMGAYFGPEGASEGFNRFNPKGYWERKDVMALNNALLAAQDCEWNDLAAWRFGEAGKASPELRRDLQTFLLELDAHRPWFIKDPRMCLTLPAWLPMLEAPVAVLVYRDPAEIALSLEKRDGMMPAHSLAVWEYHMVGMLNATLPLPRIYVQHAALLQRPVKSCETLYNALVEHGVRRIAMPSAHEIKAFIDPVLYRAKAPPQPFSAHHQLLAEITQGLRPQEGPLRISEESRKIMRDNAKQG